jgi:hypothetical protein
VSVAECQRQHSNVFQIAKECVVHQLAQQRQICPPANCICFTGNRKETQLKKKCITGKFATASVKLDNSVLCSSAMEKLAELAPLDVFHPGGNAGGGLQSCPIKKRFGDIIQRLVSRALCQHKKFSALWYLLI